MTKPAHVIIGASLAGAKAAETLRADGFDATAEASTVTTIAPNGHKHSSGRADHDNQVIDRNRVSCAVADLLTALGRDLADPELTDTPRRVADALMELLTPPPFQATTFPNDAGYDELVIARAIPFQSLCAHHLLPFTGVAHIGYLPAERIVGLSKLARVVHRYARDLQNQERLTVQIGTWLQDNLAPKGVGVVLEAEHLCMTIRGVAAHGARTITSSLHGLVRDDPRTRAEFLALTNTTVP